MSYTLFDQVDPAAMAAWNLFVEDACQENLDALTVYLREDFPSFCGLLLQVKPKGGGYTVPFLFNQVQRRMWAEMCIDLLAGRPLWYVLLKFRQAGMSTFWDAWLFWQMWRQGDIQTMVIAHQTSTAETMIETMKVFYDNLPPMFQPELREGNHGATIPRGEVYFADRRCWCLVHLSKNKDPRGGQPTHVLETEHASYEYPEEINKALIPALPTFGSEARARSSFIIESTPKGANAFYKLYKNARDGKDPTRRALFFPFFLFDEQYSAAAPPEFRMDAAEKAEQKRLSRLRRQWPVDLGGGKDVTRDQMWWRRGTIEGDFEGDEDAFKQEYPSDDVSCWLLGSKSVFKDFTNYLLASIEDAKDRATEAWAKNAIDGKAVVTKGPIRGRFKTDLDRSRSFTPISKVQFEPHPHGQWLVWEPSVVGHKYSIGADPALGIAGRDFSAACVIDVTAGRQVAEFCSSVGPEYLADEIAAAGYWYNQALLVPEVNSIGYILLKRLIGNIMYPNLFRWPKWDEVNRYTHKRGWETNNRTKQLAVSTMTTYLDDQIIAVASKELVDEMSTFEATEMDGYWDFGASSGEHDDRVMAFGLALAGVEQTPILNMELARSRKIPSTTELHLAASAADIPPTVLPSKIQELIAVKMTTHWSCFSESGVA